MTVKIGPVGIGAQEPRIKHVTETRHFDVPDCKAQGITLTPPNVPWRMEIEVSPTFVPKDIDPTKSESRHLGAVIEQAGFQPLFGP